MHKARFCPTMHHAASIGGLNRTFADPGDPPGKLQKQVSPAKPV